MNGGGRPVQDGRVPAPVRYLEQTMPSTDPLMPRTAPPGLTLPVPLHVQLASAVMGAATVLLGLVYLVTPPRLGGAAQPFSTVDALTPPLAWCMVAGGAAVILATVARAARSSTHGVTAVVHLTYCVGLAISALQQEPVRITVVSVLSVFAFIAHGGACIDYWKRGWK
jgi:hypothetical protein